MTPRKFLLLSSLIPFLVGPLFLHAQFKERERTYDVLHYTLDIRVDEKKGSVAGTVTMRLVPLDRRGTIEVDAAEMDIHSVALQSGVSEPVKLRYRHEGQKLTVSFPQTVGSTDTLAIVMSYSCRPRNGMYFKSPDSGYPDRPWQVWTQGETEDNHFWFPCYDYPNDMATMEMRVTVNGMFMAISNGALMEVTANPVEKTKTYYWYSAKPFSSYLISLIVGEYVKIEESYKNIPVQYFVYPGQEHDAMRSFSGTVGMMKFFSEKLRYDYPWPKYAQTIVSEFTYGGMENTSATTLTDKTIHSERAHLDVSSDNLVAHELAHQWFGDLVTCRNWSHAWLNEGFASYFQALWVEHSLGREEFQYDMLGKQKSVIDSDTGMERRPTVTDLYEDPFDVFDGRIYARGAAILHMLRFVLGDELFWNGMHHYLDLHQHQPVSTDDFRRAMEEAGRASGQDLDWFFNQWVVKAGNPVFDVAWSYDGKTKKIHMTIKQVQHVDDLTPLYRMPVEISVATHLGKSIHRVQVEAKAEQQIEISSGEEPLNVVFDEGGWILKQTRQTKPTRQWLYQMQHSGVAGRVEALRALQGKINEPDVQAAVSNILAHDAFWGVRKEAAEALGKADSASIIPLLAPAFRDPIAKVRLAATTALRSFKNLDALVALGNLVESDSSYAVIAEAITSLVAIDPDNGMRYCEKGLSLDSHNDVIRAASVKAMGTLRTDEARRRLEKLLEYGQPREVRVAALEALAGNWPSDDDVRRILERGANDRLQHVRRKALEKLSGYPKSRAHLERVQQEDPDIILRREARKALLRIDRQNAQ